MSPRRKSCDDKINAARAVRRSTGVLHVYPSSPAETVPFPKEGRTGKVVLAFLVVAAVVMLLVSGGLMLSGCASLGAFGRFLEGSGDLLQKQPHPGVAFAGVFVSLAGAALTAIGAKYEKPIVKYAGAVVLAGGIGGAGIQNAPLVTNEHESPAPIVVPEESDLPGAGADASGEGE